MRLSLHNDARQHENTGPRTIRWESSVEVSRADQIMFDSRLRHYDALFSSIGRTTLRGRRLLDAGCANGKWLEICCARWGAQPENCFGTDQREAPWNKWRDANPSSKVTFLHVPAHQIKFPADSFDIVHQSMMLSSIIDPVLQRRSAEVLWQLLSPGGILISYDFWLNPLNPATVGVGAKDLRRLFPESRQIFSCSLTLAPPLARKISFLGKSTALALEKTRCMNTHLLIALQRDRQN